MLTFKQCGQCANIVYCPHAENYNKEIEIVMNAQAAFQTTDVMATCIYFEQETNLPRTFKNECQVIGACLREEVREMKLIKKSKE
jgi:hypothetical protein